MENVCHPFLVILQLLIHFRIQHAPQHFVTYLKFLTVSVTKCFWKNYNFYIKSLNLKKCFLTLMSANWNINVRFLVLSPLLCIVYINYLPNMNLSVAWRKSILAQERPNSGLHQIRYLVLILLQLFYPVAFTISEFYPISKKKCLRLPVAQNSDISEAARSDILKRVIILFIKINIILIIFIQ